MAKKTPQKTPTDQPPAKAPSAPSKLAGFSPPNGADEAPKAPETGASEADALKAPPLPVTVLESCRDTTADAVYFEAVELLGLSDRDAQRLAEAIADRLRASGDDDPADVPPEAFFDLRREQDYQYPGDAAKVRLLARGVPVRRDPKTITTICVHQTAVEFGVSQRAIKAAGGHVELARARRALDVACHALAFRQGYFVAAHDLDVYVNHAGRFNAESLGLEIDGRYPGLRDDPKTIAREDLKTTWGGKPTELTDATIDAAISAIRWLTVNGRAAGMPIAKIVSHRQSSDTRRSDPGEEIWQEIVIPAARELDLKIVTASPWNTGRPVPVEWDPENGIGSY